MGEKKCIFLTKKVLNSLLLHFNLLFKVMSGNTLFWFLKNSNIMYLWLRDRFWMFAKMLKIKRNQHQIRKKRSLLQYKLLYIKCSLNVWLLCFVSWSSLCSYFRWNISQTWLSRHKLPLIYRKNRSLICERWLVVQGDQTSNRCQHILHCTYSYLRIEIWLKIWNMSVLQKTKKKMHLHSKCTRNIYF